MKRLLNCVGMTLGAWIGWQIGILISVFSAFIVGVVGSGVGLYAAQRIVRGLVP